MFFSWSFFRLLRAQSQEHEGHAEKQSCVAEMTTIESGKSSLPERKEQAKVKKGSTVTKRAVDVDVFDQKIDEREKTTSFTSVLIEASSAALLVSPTLATVDDG